MKILHLLYESKGDYFGIGGVGVRAYEIYKHLKDRHDITLLCKKYIGAKDAEIEGLRHIFVGVESKSLTKTLLSYAYHCSWFVKKFGKDYDIIIEEFSPAIPTFLPFFTDKPIILQVQGYTGKLYFSKYNLFFASALYLMEQLRPKFYRNLIFVSSDTSKKFVLRKDSYVKFISNGISSDLLKVSPSEGDYLLYLGRIDIYGKGLDILVKAFEKFYKSFPDIKLLIAGDGRDVDEFNSMLMDLPEDVREKVELTGWVTGKTKQDLLSKALFVVLPSRHEVQPITALEAMACGKAVIASDITGFNFVTDNRAGISFKTGDAASLAHAMRNCITSNERNEMGKRGREWVKDFTWDRIALKYEGFLEDVISSWKQKCDITNSKKD